MAALLAFELSPNPCSLAVLTEDGKLHAREFSGERGRALLHELDLLLREADVERSALAGILVGIGPGSYTGLRIACTAARTCSYALDIPCAGLGSFEAAIARHAQQHELWNQEIHVLLDAYRGEVYHGTGIFDGEQVQLTLAPRVIALEKLPSLASNQAILCDARLDEKLADWQPHRYLPHASELLQLARARGVGFDGSGFDALPQPEPLYLRAAAFRS